MPENGEFYFVIAARPMVSDLPLPIGSIYFGKWINRDHQFFARAKFQDGKWFIIDKKSATFGRHATIFEAEKDITGFKVLSHIADKNGKIYDKYYGLADQLSKKGLGSWGVNDNCGSSVLYVFNYGYKNGFTSKEEYDEMVTDDFINNSGGWGKYKFIEHEALDYDEFISPTDLGGDTIDFRMYQPVINTYDPRTLGYQYTPMKIPKADKVLKVWSNPLANTDTPQYIKKYGSSDPTHESGFYTL